MKKVYGIDLCNKESLKTKPKTSKIKKKYNRELLFITLPALIKIIVFSFVPLFWLVMSFQFYIPKKGILGSDFVGFQNFKYLIESNIFFRLISNALIMNLLDIIFSNLVSIILGLLLFELMGKIRVKWIQTFFFFPYFINWAVAGSLLSTFIGDTGFITNLLTSLTGESYDFYNNPSGWWFIIVFMGVWKGAGVAAVVNYAVLIGVDREYYEAADIDGANRFHKMIFLSIPYMKNMIIVGIIMSCSNLLRYDFSRVYFLTGQSSALSKTTEVIETYMYKAMRTSGLYEPGTAIGLLQSCVGLVLCTIANFITKKISAESSLF